MSGGLSETCIATECPREQNMRSSHWRATPSLHRSNDHAHRAHRRIKCELLVIMSTCWPLLRTRKSIILRPQRHHRPLWLRRCRHPWPHTHAVEGNTFFSIRLKEPVSHQLESGTYRLLTRLPQSHVNSFPVQHRPLRLPRHQRGRAPSTCSRKRQGPGSTMRPRCSLERLQRLLPGSAWRAMMCQCS